MFGVARSILLAVSGKTLAVERKKPGRKSKGDRCQVNTRQPRVLTEAAEAEAARRGMTMTNFVGQLLADAVGLPYQSQGELPLKTSA